MPLDGMDKGGMVGTIWLRVWISLVWALAQIGGFFFSIKQRDLVMWLRQGINFET